MRIVSQLRFLSFVALVSTLTLSCRADGGDESDTGSDEDKSSDSTVHETTHPADDSSTSTSDASSQGTGDGETESESTDASTSPEQDSDATDGDSTTTDTGISDDGSSTSSTTTDNGGDEACDLSGVSIDIAYLTTHLESIAGGRPALIDGKMETISERKTDGNKALARKYLTALLEADGFAVSEHKFSGGVNLVADKPGSGDKTLIVSGHLDSMDCPGADDDASGVITALAVMHALRGCKSEASLRFVAFDLEEAGLVGSKAYADDLAGSGDHKQLIGDFQIEMTGYDSNNDGRINLIDCAEERGTLNDELKQAVVDAIAQSDAPLAIETACTDRSDHASFWEHDVPGIVVSQLFFGSDPDSNSCYHQMCDAVDRINYEYMHAIAQVAIVATAKLIGATK